MCCKINAYNVNSKVNFTYLTLGSSNRGIILQPQVPLSGILFKMLEDVYRDSSSKKTASDAFFAIKNYELRSLVIRFETISPAYVFVNLSVMSVQKKVTSRRKN